MLKSWAQCSAATINLSMGCTLGAPVLAVVAHPNRVRLRPSGLRQETNQSHLWCASLARRKRTRTYPAIFCSPPTSGSRLSQPLAIAPLASHTSPRVGLTQRGQFPSPRAANTEGLFVLVSLACLTLSTADGIISYKRYLYLINVILAQAAKLVQPLVFLYYLRKQWLLEVGVAYIRGEHGKAELV